MSHVCQAWRVAAIHSSQLWTVLYVPLLSRHTNALKYVELCLERSHHSLLDIHIETPSASQKRSRRIPARVEMERAIQAIQFLIPPISRCRTLTIRLAYTFALKNMLWELHSSVESLESLDASSMYYHGHSGDLPSREINRLMNRTRQGRVFPETFLAPKLQSLQFNGLNPWLPQQYPALQHLSMAGPCHIYTLNSTASEFTSLQTVHVDNCILVFPQGQHLNLPSLTKLSSNGPWINLDRFLQRCSMPQLSCIAISSYEGDPRCPLLGLEQSHVGFSVTLKFPFLHTVVFENIAVKYPTTEANYPNVALTDMDFCHALYLHCTGNWQSALDAWVEPRGGRWQCPALERLTIVSEKVYEEESIRRVIDARYEASREASLTAPVALRRLHLKTRYPVAAERLEWYQARVPDFEWTDLGPRPVEAGQDGPLA